MTYNAKSDWGSQPASGGSGAGRPAAPQSGRELPPAQPRPAAPLGPQPNRPGRASVQQSAGQGPAPQRRGGCGRLALTALILFALLVLGVGVLLIGYATIARDLPQPEELQTRVSHFASTLIYDRDGDVLNEVGDPNYGRRTAVPLDQISQYLRDATIATEDPNFYKHRGVDPVGLLRALYYSVRYRSLSGPGGSTITQQLVKLTFLSPERTISRKVKEAILAAEITRRYPKDTVLEIYLNEINYGNLAYGIQAASETYFGKNAADLTLAQAAMIAGLPQAPAYYDPYTKLWEADNQPGAVKRRQGEVLRLMVEREFITSDQADAAWAEPLDLQPLVQVYDSRYPHFVQYAREQVEGTLGPELASKGGLRIHTTLDPRIQAAAQEEVTAQVAKLASQGGRNSAVVAIRPTTGEVLALIGSADFENVEISGQINMALTPRQPGSSIKPLTYLAAFELPAAVSTKPQDVQAAQQARIASLETPTGPEPPAPEPEVSAIEPPGYWTPATPIMDIRTELPDGANKPPYVPYNYGGSDRDVKEHGLVSVRTALANSYNIPAVKALEHVGIDRLKDVARRAGITTLTRDDYGLSLTLGGGEVTLLEMTGAYATLANGGVRVPASPIACVLDADGRLIWRGGAADAVAGCRAALSSSASAVTPEAPQKAFNPQHVYQITSILSDAEARNPTFGGVAKLMSLADRPSAVKTGTTNDNRDAWTLGYTPDLAVGVWVGNADYSTMKGVAGATGAVPIWHNVMARALEGQPAQPFTPPAGSQRAVVCADSGTLPGEACPAQREEVFAENQGPLPAAYDLWQRIRIDRVTGKLATEFTPADRIETRDGMIFPQKYRDWAAAHNYPVITATQVQIAFEPELALYSPADSSMVSGPVLVQGRVRVPPELVWRLEYGDGPMPGGWGILRGPEAGGDQVVEGVLGEWDVPATAARDGFTDFTLRLAAYYPENLDYPVAISNVAYVVLEAGTETPSPTPTEEETATPTATPEGTPSPTPEETPLAENTPRPVESVTPEPSAAPTLVVPGTVRAAIVQPLDLAQVAGQVEIVGVADGPGFAGYVVEYAAGDWPAEGEWLPVAPPSLQPISGGVLAVWRTEALPPGLYSLRVRVMDNAGAVQIVTITVTVAPAP